MLATRLSEPPLIVILLTHGNNYVQLKQKWTPSASENAHISATYPSMTMNVLQSAFYIAEVWAVILFAKVW